MADLLLLTPGPVQIPKEVVEAGAQPMTHHNAPEFQAIFKPLLMNLRPIFGNDGPILIQNSSARGAIEASLTNLFSPGDPVAIIVNGRFGLRWADIAKDMGLTVHPVSPELGRTAREDAIAETLARHPEIKGLAGCMCETDTGVMNDIAMIGRLGKRFGIVTVVDAVPAKSVKELIALAKAKPGQLNFEAGSTGSSAHLAGELFKIMAGVNIVHVPYKGMAPALVDRMSGQLQIMFSNPAASYAHVKSGKLRALAVTGDKRSPKLPALPTVAEAGLPGFEASTWWGVFAPTRTPAGIVARLNAELARALEQRDVRDRITALDAEVVGGPSKRLADHLRAEIPKWAKVVKAAQIRF